MRVAWVSVCVGLSCLSFGQGLAVGETSLPKEFVETVERLVGKE